MTQKRISVRFGAEGGREVRAEFEGVGRAGTASLESIQRQARSLGETFDRIGRQLRVAGAAFSAAGAGVALAVRGQLQLADEMGKAAQRVGLQVEELSRLAYAADLSGLSLAQLEQGLVNLSRQMVNNSESIEALGIDLRDADGNLRATEEVLFDVADALAAVPEGAERTALAMELFGRSGAQLLPMLAGGAEGLRGMTEEAKRLGREISGATAEAASEFHDNLARLRSTVSGLWAQIAEELAPILAEVAGIVQRVTERFAQLDPQAQRVAATLAAITVATGPLLLALGSLVPLIKGLALGSLALSGPLGVVLALLAAGAVAWVAFRDRSAETEDPLVAVRQAQETLNEALGTFANSGAPSAARASVQYAKTLEQQARAALAAAEAELALMEAEAARFRAAPPEVRGLLGDSTDRALQRNIELAAGEVETLRSTLDGARRTLNALQIGLHDTGEAAGGLVVELEEIVITTDAVDDALKRVGGGGGSAAAMAAALEEIGAQSAEVMVRVSEMESAFESAFVGIVTGANSAREALRSLLNDLSRMLAQQAFRSLVGAIFGGGAVQISGPAMPRAAAMGAPLRSFEGGGFTGWGPRSGGLDGRGGFLTVLHPRETVIDHHKGQTAPAGRVEITIKEAPGFAAAVETVAQGVAVRTVRAGINEYDREALPARVGQISRDPWRRG